MTDCQTDTEYLAILRRILETPADDAPRLIIADWLEENGEEERAIWIREEVKRPRTAIIVSDLTIGASSLDEYAVSWSRGFISEVRLTCAEFMGGRCEECDGRGVVVTTISAGIFAECGKCSGTGRVPGVARALFQAHPITAVRLVDRKPRIQSVYGFPTVYVWEPNEVPELIFRCYYDEVNRDFPSEAAALDAISDAAVAYGRNLANLPPIS